MAEWNDSRVSAQLTPGVLRARRGGLLLTQKELARALGVAPNTVARWERGERPIPQALALALDGLQVTRRKRSGQRSTVPRPRTSFVGRTRELEQLRILVHANRLVTLVGPGGVGKTRLALEIASRLSSEFEGGAAWVELASVHDPHLVLVTVADALGVRELAHQPPLAALEEHLRDRHMLLVLDNLEHLLPAVGDIGELLRTCPGLSVLVTSRAPLRGSGEQEFPLRPLAVPDQTQLPPIHELCQHDAVRLFIDRARAIKPDFELTAATAPVVAAITARLDGLPLAIELAVARLRALTAHEILRRLEHRLTLLVGGANDLPPRQQTMRATLAWSLDLLEPAERRLFRSLAVFVGGCSLHAMERVGADSPDHTGGDVLQRLESLVAHGLVECTDAGATESRFGMLETIREYALELLDAAGESAHVERCFADYYLALAQEAGEALWGRAMPEWLQRLRKETANLRRTLRLLIDARRSVDAQVMAASLARFWLASGQLAEGRRWLTEALSAGGSNDGARARALIAAAALALLQGDMPAGQQLVTEGLQLARQVGDWRFAG
jgi:predicted ATPase